MKNDRLLKALSCENHSGRPPVWIMRQAGRYMPEYRAIREKHSFLEMCHNPELAAEITLQPIRAFGMDAAILFCDILVIPEALEVGLQFIEKKGPVIERPLRAPDHIAALPDPDIADKLGYVAKAIGILKPQLDIPLIGFCGAPFTVASYMIEGGSSRELKLTKQWMMRDPESFHSLLQLLTRHTIEYLKLQIQAGVDAIQIFDSWANYLAAPQFREFSLRYLKQILQEIPEIPSLLFCRGSSVFAEELAEANPSGISLDWNADIAKMRQRIPKNIALQGNLDPDVLYGSPQAIRKEVERLLVSMKDEPGYIFNLGHGIKPDMTPDAVRCMVDCIKNWEGSDAKNRYIGCGC